MTKRIFKSLTELIGNTPLLELTNLPNNVARILVKLEMFNPGKSVKDRIALSMIEDAERKGILQPGGVIIEPTSGNTGIGLAWISAIKGYRAIFTMPESMSKERQDVLTAYGATVVLTSKNEGMQGAIRKAVQLQKEIDGSVILNQFENVANSLAHYCTTAKEIWNASNGDVDMFIAGVGTGGTLSGVGKGLKECRRNIRIVGVEPSESAVLSGGSPSAHKIQGIGAGFIPPLYDQDVVDAIVRVTEEEAIKTSSFIAKKYGLLVGISSGAVIAAAIKQGELSQNTGKVIVALLPDMGERYLSMGIFV